MCNRSRLLTTETIKQASMNNRASLEKSQVYFGWKLQWQNQWQVNEHGRSAYPFLSNINLTHPMNWVSRERCHKEDCGHCCSVPGHSIGTTGILGSPAGPEKAAQPFLKYKGENQTTLSSAAQTERERRKRVYDAHHPYVSTQSFRINCCP